MWELWRYVWPWSLQFMGCDTMQFDILYRYWYFEICIFAVLVSLTDVYLRLSSLSRHVHAGCKRHCSVNAKKPFPCLMQFVVHSLFSCAWHFQDTMQLPSSLSCAVHCTFHSPNKNVQCCCSDWELSQMTESGCLLQLTCDWKWIQRNWNFGWEKNRT